MQKAFRPRENYSTASRRAHVEGKNAPINKKLKPLSKGKITCRPQENHRTVDRTRQETLMKMIENKNQDSLKIELSSYEYDKFIAIVQDNLIEKFIGIKFK